ncbi:DELTA-sagatoxin-Srs1a-like [Nerophis ophidion]|uniref:DELTA-sagatoxin-Srs1a-like n=1 Tax=Nerophis ophidion TaxID=159077 RepID=UPI002AE089DD|nr:DELTA-sagatoxin-Srs1a-like [Nerophis ophidion]
MPETAESHMVSLTTNRNCTVEICNVTSTFCLTNPKVHMESGYPYSPPQPTVRTGRNEVCSFTKDDNTASGAVGVLTYELFNMQQRRCTEVVALMFSVPFDYTFYKNWLGVGVFPHAMPVDHKLFQHMYEEKEFSDFVRHEADGSGVVYKGQQVDVRACMSDEGRAIVKLEVYNTMG